MAYNFRCVDRDQQFLMPPSVRDWLPEGHLAWFVLDVVEQLDLSAFYARYRVDGRGGAAYEPAAMVALLLYAYCIGDRSSRLLERRCVEDVAYRVIAANARPDHATIARFRVEHEDALAGLFGQVLTMCAEAGMVRVGVVALDGTKVSASAAKAANHDLPWVDEALRAEAARILAEAAAIDDAEDEAFGMRSGGCLPPELAHRATRLRRLREAKARLEAAHAERPGVATDVSRQADVAACHRPGTEPVGRDEETKRMLVNTTDPESALMKISGGWMQAYNAQAIATPGQVLIAAEITAAGVDVRELEPMLALAVANLTKAGVDEPIGVLLADAGYYSTDNATLEVDCELLIAPAKERKLPNGPSDVLDRIAEADRVETDLVAARANALQQVCAGELTVRQAAVVLGLGVSRTYVLYDRYRAEGADGLVRKHRKGARREKPRRARILRTMDTMRARLASDEGRALYRQRSQIIEPVFGQIKDGRGFRSFSRRGAVACASEWKLMAATHNLLKLHRQRAAVLAA